MVQFTLTLLLTMTSGQASAQTCVSDWVVQESAEVPCHIDIDRHLFYRTAEAWGVDVLVDANGCSAEETYERVELASVDCSYPFSINGESFGDSSHECAVAAWFLVIGDRLMPEEIYDNDTCPENASSGGIGNPVGPPTMAN